MTADTLHRAATLMRSRAEAATRGPWENDGQGQISHINGHSERMYVSECYSDAPGQADAEHIASWHPAVALAVADWLDLIANLHDFGSSAGPAVQTQALAVATAYLAEADADGGAS